MAKVDLTKKYKAVYKGKEYTVFRINFVNRKATLHEFDRNGQLFNYFFVPFEEIEMFEDLNTI